MDAVKKDKLRNAVRDNYGRIALAGEAGCGCASSSASCCGSPAGVRAEEVSREMGYSAEDLAAVPDGANMGLGCGNPQTIAALQPGETVLDLGSGGGFDCFLAVRAVGTTGRVIGVDMTAEMVSKARENAARAGFANVDFRLGELENLPVGDEIVDVILSNCVINLSPDKARVFDEAYRVLKPGGRLAISDIVAIGEIPDDIQENMAFYAGCIGGASSITVLESMLRQSGFQKVRITPREESRSFIREWMPGSNVEKYVVSAIIEAEKE
ncbi:MAG: arsenite methyltransferase [Desulfopila sp.]|jgi:SAM-dependent methyltransferase|nr:arsenite methyltransferase [Desulfopila sp.]